MMLLPLLLMLLRVLRLELLLLGHHLLRCGCVLPLSPRPRNGIPWLLLLQLQQMVLQQLSLLLLQLLLLQHKLRVLLRSRPSQRWIKPVGWPLGVIRISLQGPRGAP